MSQSPAQEKREAKGYVAYLSPKSKCKNTTRPQFEIHIQDNANSLMKVKGFGDDAYRKLLPYAKDKSPVKVQLFKNENYPLPVFGQRSTVESATFSDVPFKLNENLKVEGGASSSSMKDSVVADINDILANKDPGKYYTVLGKVHKGPGSEKCWNGKRLKDDNMVFDKKKSIRLTLWNNGIDQVDNGSCYEISHLRFKEFDGIPQLTCSPHTIITAVKDEGFYSIPENFVISEELETIVVEKFGKIGKPNQYAACGACGRKVVDSDIRKRAYSCATCDGSLDIAKLKGNQFIINVNVISGEDNIFLLLPADVGLTLFEGITDAQEIADELFTLVGKTVMYDPKNNFIKKVLMS